MGKQNKKGRHKKAGESKRNHKKHMQPNISWRTASFSPLDPNLYTGASSSVTCSLCSAGTYSSSSGMHHSKYLKADRNQKIREVDMHMQSVMQTWPAYNTIYIGWQLLYESLDKRLVSGASSSATCSLCSAGTYSSSSGMHHTKQSNTDLHQKFEARNNIFMDMHMQTESEHILDDFLNAISQSRGL